MGFRGRRRKHRGRRRKPHVNKDLCSCKDWDRYEGTKVLRSGAPKNGNQKATETKTRKHSERTFGCIDGNPNKMFVRDNCQGEFKLNGKELHCGNNGHYTECTTPQRVCEFTV